MRPADIPGAGPFVEVKFRLGYLEAAGAMRAFVLAQRAGRVLSRSGWILIILPLVLSIVNVIPLDVAILPVLTGGFILTLIWLIPLVVVPIVRSRMPGARLPQSYVFDETGIETSAFGVASRSSWHSVARVVESRRFIVFFVSAVAAWAIPKRHLSADDLKTLRDLINTHVGKDGDGAGVRDVDGPDDADVRFRAEFEWTPERLYRASMATYRHTPKLWMYILVVLYLAVFVVHAYLPGESTAPFSLPAFLVRILPVVLVLFAGPVASWVWSRRHLRSPSTAAGHQEIRIATNGLVAIGRTYKGVISWAALYRVVETDEFFLFFLSKAAAIPIPRDAFASTEHAGIRSFLQSRLSERFRAHGAQ